MIEHQDKAVNTLGVAQISNVENAAMAIERLLNRKPGSPGLGVLYGPAGDGKTIASNYVCNLYRGYYVQVRSAWTRKVLLEKILAEMGVAKATGTLSNLLDQVAEQLAASKRPLVIDEADHAVKSDALVELIRDIHDAAGNAAILLVGEEQMPRKLKKWERMYGRVLAWVPTQRATLEDARALAGLYVNTPVADDMLEMVMRESRYSTRRICTNLELINDVAVLEDWSAITLAGWGQRTLNNGEPPRRGK